jgi:hypothetical protein
MEQIERSDLYRKESGFNYIEDGDSWAFNDGVWHFNDDSWSSKIMFKNKKAAMINPPNLDDVMDKQKDFLTWYTTGDNKHYVGDKLIEKYKKEVLNK